MTNIIKKKRSIDEVYKPCCASPRKRSITWAEETQVFHQKDTIGQVKDYKSDLWYSKTDYGSFELDRQWAVQNFRAFGSFVSLLDPNLCFRGLEPFYTEESRVEAALRRKNHESVIIDEQVRQMLHGLSDPERFPVLVSEQSKKALERAQALAAADQHEIYDELCKLPIDPDISNCPHSENVSQEIKEGVEALRFQHPTCIVKPEITSVNSVLIGQVSSTQLPVGGIAA